MPEDLPGELTMVSSAHHFAAKLAATALGDAQMDITIGLSGLQGRELVAHGTNLYFSRIKSRTATTKSVEVPLQYSRDELIAKWTELSLRASADVIRHFGGTDLPSDSLKLLQADYLKPIA